MNLLSYMHIEPAQIKQALVETYSTVTGKLSTEGQRNTEWYIGKRFKPVVEKECASLIRESSKQMIGSKLNWIPGSTIMVVNTKAGTFGLVDVLQSG